MKENVVYIKKVLLTITLFLCSISFAQVGIGTSTPHESAVLEIASTTKGFLPPRMTQIEMNNISSPVEGLLVYCKTDKSIHMYNGDEWIKLVGNEVVETSSTKISTITSSTGRIWMAYNLGAIQQASSTSDSDNYGDYYQWGRTTDGHEDYLSDTFDGAITASEVPEGKFIIDTDGSNGFAGSVDWLTPSDESRWSDDNDKGIYDPCPEGFRVPSNSEWQAEFNEYGSDIYSVLHLTKGGYRSENGLLDDDFPTEYNNQVWYWTSSADYSGTTRGKSFAIKFLSKDDNINMTAISSARTTGIPIRCIKE